MPGWLSAISAFLTVVGKALGLIQTNEDKKAGIAMQSAVDNQAAAKTQQAIAQAEVDAPRTDEAVEQRLRDDKF